MKYFFVFCASLTFFVNTIIASEPQFDNIYPKKPAFFAYYFDSWVDSIMRTLTTEEKIGQLFMVEAYSNKENCNFLEIVNQINKYKIGGICFFQGSPVKQAALTNYYQKISRVPLLIGIDGEWGLAMRLDSTVKYPKQVMLGASENDNMVYQLGRDIGKQCRRMGIQINFAPSVDVNNNAHNPVINARSFGEDPKMVMHKGFAYINGLEDEYVLATAKHFPGHGDTDADSHLMLPIIKKSRSELKSMELVPFKYLINRGLQSAMIGHLYVPALDTTNNLPASLSATIIRKVLKEDMKFDGFIFSDAMNMKGVAAFYKSGESAVRAFEAGIDMILMPENLEQAVSALKLAVDSGKIAMRQLDERCRRVLMLKRWAQLNNYQPVDLNNLYEDLNQPIYSYHKRRMAEESITLLINKNDFLPLRRLDTLKIASVTIGTGDISAFHQSLSRYAPITSFAINRTATAAQFDSLSLLLKNYNLIIVGIVNTDMRVTKNYGIGSTTVPFINKLTKEKNVIVDDFANAYSSGWFEQNNGLLALIESFEDLDIIQDISGQMIFGGLPFKGKLPVTVSPNLEVDKGIQTEDVTRLAYTTPEEFGLSNASFSKVDSLANQVISQQTAPGCQIMVIKNGKVLYHKSYGNFTYDNTRPTTTKDVYDIASISKIAGTLPAVIKLTDEKKINVTHKLKEYLPLVINSNKENLILQDILTHQAGLVHFIPFYIETLQKNTSDSLNWLKSGLYSQHKQTGYSLQVADSLYIADTYSYSIFKRILDSDVSKKKKYEYSDLGFILLAKMVENMTQKSLDKYVDSVFYKPLGMTTLGYRPLERLPISQIAPTENDTVFRHQVVRGFVHDPGAAMLGGVSGHAGLFSDANDLAKLMQLYMWQGKYGGERYFSEHTFYNFSKAPFLKTGNRRGLGFDKPEVNYFVPQSPCECATLSSYGHTGFTGTMVWSDPDSQLIYIFLSNRVYPDASVNKLAKSNLRTQIHEEIYKIFGLPCPRK